MKTVIRTIPHGLRLIDAEEDKYIRLWANEAFGDLEICKRFEYQTGANYCILVYSGDEPARFFERAVASPPTEKRRIRAKIRPFSANKH